MVLALDNSIYDVHRPGDRTRDAGLLDSFSVFSVLSVARFFGTKRRHSRWASCVSPTYD